MANNEYKYYAFLSYSPQDNRADHADSPAAGRRRWGNWLAEALKAFSIPPEFVGQINGRGEIIPERIAPLYWDESELSEGATLSAEIRQALEHSLCLIVIGSPRSAQSRQVNEVVRYFKQIGRGNRIFPIVVAGEPNASTGNKSDAASADECFVPALRHPVQPDGMLDLTRRASKHIFVDARHGVEQREILASDHRSAEADLEMAKIHLIALLLGVGFNGLWQREQKRHFFEIAEAQRQVQEARNQVESVQRQLQEAQRQAREAQKQSLELQNLPRDVQGQIQEAQTQAHEAQNQVRVARQQIQEFEKIVRDTQSQLEEARQRALAAESKVRKAQQQAREVQTQQEETRTRVREAQNTGSQIQELQNQARSAQAQLKEAREQLLQAEGKVLEAHQQPRDAQDRVQQIPNPDRNSRRLTKVFALLAALALMAAGLVASQAWRQRQIDRQALAKAAAETSGTFELASGDSIQRLLQKIGGAEQAENRQRSLDHLAAGIPQDEISEALKAASVIASDQPRSHFQKSLLIRLGRLNPVSAMTHASAIAGKIVNDEGLSDSSLYFQLAVLDIWIQNDWPGAFNWICQLSDADARQRALDKIIRSAQSQPDSEAKKRMLLQCVGELARTDIAGAFVLAEFLPEGSRRNATIAWLWMNAAPLAVSEWINSLIFPPGIMSPHKASWPWSDFFQNANVDDSALHPTAKELGK